MKHSVYLLFVLIALFSPHRSHAGNPLIGLQGAELRTFDWSDTILVGRDTVVKFHTTITDSEKIVLNNLRINYIWEADTGKQNWNDMMAASEEIMDWADGNGGYPKVCVREYHVTPGGWPMAGRKQASPTFPNNNWGNGYIAYDTNYHVLGDTFHIGINVDMPGWMQDRANDFSLGNSADAGFQDTVR